MRRMKRTPLRIAALVLVAASASCASGGAERRAADPAMPPKIAAEDLYIPSRAPGIRLFVRNKRPDGAPVAPDKILLFVHGATYPSETSFDLPLGGMSWMDFLAGHGWDVYLVDVRGYGRSTRPPEMDEPPDRHAPIVSTDDAVEDVGAAVDFIRARRSVERVTLLGWSWGTSIMGGYTARNPERVAKLVLYAPQWIRTAATPSLVTGEGAYRTVSMASAKDRWLKGVAEDKKSDLIPAGWFEQWAEATFATDPVGSKQSPRVLRAPNGVIQDGRTYWSSGKAYYDPARITVPTLVIHAEWDQDLPTPLAQAVFARLTSAPYRRFVEIGEGTHTVIMEKNRMELFREVQLFLDESPPAAR
jgi:pimeloyl-ACP methyl ester carboxylesterase